jgi:hypothetical protein
MVELPVIIWSLDTINAKWTDMLQRKVQRWDFVVTVMNIHVQKCLEQLISHPHFRQLCAFYRTSGLVSK